MNKKNAKQLIVAAILTSWLATPMSVLAQDVSDWNGLNTAVTTGGAVNVTGVTIKTQGQMPAGSNTVITGTVNSVLDGSDYNGGMFTNAAGNSLSISGLKLTGGNNTTGSDSSVIYNSGSLNIGTGTIFDSNGAGA